MDVGVEAVAAGQLLDLGQQERRGLLAVDPSGVHLIDGIVDGLVDHGVVHGVFLRDRIGHQHAALHSDRLLDMEGLRAFFGRIHPVVHLQAGVAAVEGWEFLGSEADDGYAVRLQILQRELQIQDGLRSRANHHHRGICQLFQVRGDIHGGFRAAMHAADAAGGKDLDSGHRRNHHRRGDRRRPVHALRHQHREVAAAGLGNGCSRLAEIVDFFRCQTNLQPPADDGDGGGGCAVFTDDLLHAQRGLHILRIRHAVGDDRGFQRHNRFAGGKRRGYFGIYVQILIHHVFPPIIVEFSPAVPSPTVPG